MSFQFPNIPDNDDELAGWLSRMVVSTELGALVHELRTVSDVNGAPSPSLLETLGESRDDVLAKGLVVLPRENLRILLRHPRLLLELQEDVLIEGGEFWSDSLSETTASLEVIERGALRLREFLEVESTPSPPPQLPITQRPWLVALVTAAAILLVVLVRNLVWHAPPDEGIKTVDVPEKQTQSPVPVQDPIIAYDEIDPAAWGWATPDVLPDDGTGEDYFYLLADLADDWFDEQPDDPRGLAHRIIEFRRGCSILMLAEHKPLKEPDRKWLLRSCRKWADELDELLADLEDQKKDFQLVRHQMNSTVDVFVDKLRDWGPIARRRDA